ncbi:hypothetical protein FRC07_007517 [Ceratobasidium sp. 392]|nr:hypothetical protein FRC07_007517 [Ceratobasidium sp. 392]
MAGPSITTRQRAKSVTGELGANRSVSDPSASVSTRPDGSPKQNRRSTRGTLSFLFPAKAERERSRTVADTLPKFNAVTAPLDASSDALAQSKSPRKRTSSKPTRPAALLARSLTTKARPLSRVEQSPTLPSIFASLPARTRDSLRQSYETPRRSFERAENFAFVELSLPPLDISDPETPTPNPHSFRISESPLDDDDVTPRRSMASFARSPITSSHPMRRISGLPLTGDDFFDPAEVYRASTADLSDFLRATGPEDVQRGAPARERGGSVKDTKDNDRDGANSTRSRTKSSLFRIGGRRREKSRPTVGPGIGPNDILPPVPILTTPGLPAFRLRDDDGGDGRSSFSQILPMLGLNEEGVGHSPVTPSPTSALLPHTREHRLPDGTTILMITTPQNVPESKPLGHSRSLNSMLNVTKENSIRPSLLGSDSAATVKPTQTRRFQPLPPRPNVSSSKPTLKTHSPTMSISSDGTLSTAERPKETDLLRRRFAVPKTPTTPQAVNGHSSMLNLQSSYLQATPTRPRGYSSPDPVSPLSAQSTPTVRTPTPMNFSPSASIAPTPELTPQKELPQLPDIVPVVRVDLAPPRKSSLTEPIIVGGLHFPPPPDDILPGKRRPITMDSPRSSPITASPTRSTKSLRVTRSPRKMSSAEDESPKGRTKRSELGARLSPLNMEAVPTYREWKTNAPSIQTQPGELTGLELDLNEGMSEPDRKRNSLMEQHQQLFFNTNPFQTPPSPADPFLTPSLKNGVGAMLPPLAGGPPPMPLPPSPSLLSQLPLSPSSPGHSLLSTNEPRRSSLTPRRSRVDSLMVRSSILFNSSPVSIASPLPPSSPVQTLTNALSAQREQFDAMSKCVLDAAKSFEEEKRAFELRIQELMAIVAEKEAKAKEDERKIQGLEWLVGNLNLRACAGKGGSSSNHTDSDDSAAKRRRRRSSFAGLGAKEDVPVTPLPIEHVLDPAERAKRAVSMNDVFRNLGALSSTGVALGLNPLLTPPNIYEWAANTVLEQD